MTNPLGAGTANVTANMPIDEARIHGRTAFELGQTRAELIRQAVLEWYEHHRPDLALKIEAIRRNHREVGSAFLLALFFAGQVALAVFGGHDAEVKKEHRRPRICDPRGIERKIEEAFV